MTKLIFYYIRLALVVHILLLITVPVLLITEGFSKSNVDAVYFCFFLLSFPVFFVLPGIIYEGEYTKSYHGFTADQLKYTLFLGITLGLGPLIIYFRKYDSLLDKMVKEGREETDLDQLLLRIIP